MKHLFALISILLLSFPVIGQSKETCYVVVDSSEEFNPSLLSNISVSIISQFLREVEPIPPAGVSKDSCLYQISVSKEQDTTFVTFKGKNLNSYGDSKLSGTDGFQQSLLKSLYRSLKRKRDLICEDYVEFLSKQCENQISVTQPIATEKTTNQFDGSYLITVHRDDQNYKKQGEAIVVVENNLMKIKNTEKASLPTGDKNYWKTLNGKIDAHGKISGTITLDIFYGTFGSWIKTDQSKLFYLEGNINSMEIKSKIRNTNVLFKLKKIY